MSRAVNRIQTGDQVTIYEDPHTKQKPEGEAILRELYSSSGVETHWRVEFTDEPGEFYERTVVFPEGTVVDAEATDE